jgi:glycosyltransferase involved in cell wall biosynthesis
VRLLYVVTEDWYFLLHRLPMALAARDNGFEVHVATRVVDGADAIRSRGIALHPVPFARGRISPAASLRTILALRALQRRIAPVVTHHVSLQTIVLGSLAALGLPTARVNALTGLGDVFTSTDRRSRILRAVVGRLLRFIFTRRGATALVENPDDKATLAALGVAPERIVHIPGSGVDVQRLRPLPEPAGPVSIAFAGRLIERKGIRTVIEAHRLLRRRGSDVGLLIAGTPDPENATSIPLGEVTAWAREPAVTWLGHVEAIADLWARAAIAVLPSHGGEGVPMSLLEAAAAGRPMVATDVPGCREIVIPGKTGILVPVNDAAALADAAETLARSPDLRSRYGAAARALVLEQFSADIVGRQTVKLYRSLIQPAEPA